MSHWESWIRFLPRLNGGKAVVKTAVVEYARYMAGFLAVLLTVYGEPVQVAAEQISATLSASDAVTMPGRPVKLEARLVRSGTLVETGLGGEQLEFLVAGKKVGVALTGGDGRGYMEYKPAMRGQQSVTVRLVPNKRVEAAEATAIVASWERRRPLLLVEHAALLQDPPKSRLPDLGVLRQSESAPATGAAEELKRLSEYYFNLIYLEPAKDKTLTPVDTRAWLKRHGFPFGLKITAKYNEDGMGEAIDELRTQGWENIQAAVGRSRDFAEALLKQRMRVIVVAEERDKELPRRIDHAQNWREARKLLQR
jgi:hypothetical protein